MTVNIAIAVGLITAGSTLAGGLIASVTALKVQSNQLKEQDSVAKAERAERRDTQRRELRREAYAQFIGRFEELDTLVDDCWDWLRGSKSESEPSGIARHVTEKILAARNALSALDSPLNIIALEGPADVQIAAHEVRFVFAQEYLRVELELIGKLVPSEKSTLGLNEDYYEESHKRRHTAKTVFIEAARTALEPTQD